MLAYRFHPGRTHLIEENIEKPRPGPNEALLAVRAAGICHSDLHVLAGEVPFLKTVFTMGHEVCGELVETGSEVPDALRQEIGKLFAVHGPNPCGDCFYCRTARDHLCDGPNRAYIGLGADGGYAEFLTLPARNIVPVPFGVTAEVAAVATDAVLTPYHALKTLGNVQAGSTALLIGLGGLGMNGVQIARALGAHVIASDVRKSSLELARQYGAAEAYDPSELPARLAGRKVDVAGDFVGREETFRLAQDAVKPGGTILLVGLGSSSVPLMTLSAASLEIRAQGSFWGTSIELREVLRWIAEGKIRPQVDTGGLSDVNNWLEKLRNGTVRSRIALVPGRAA